MFFKRKEPKNPKKVFTFVDDDYIRYVISPDYFYVAESAYKDWYNVKAAVDGNEKHDVIVAVGELDKCNHALNNIWEQLKEGKDIIYIWRN